ncbi:MAG: hypothetical protein H7Z72_18350 [Bacteroidetes bacterium]|nr:hypothetical protein [Fibrella sp.]
MKKIVLFLVIALSFAACSKKEDVEPKGTASEVVGVYKLTSFTYQSKDGNAVYPELPVVQRGKETDFGTVTLTETDDLDKVTMGVDFTLPTAGFGDLEDDEFIEELEVVKNGSKYDLKLPSGSKLATINGNTLSLDGEGEDFSIAFTADR